jgi:hypothetical protein
LALTAVCAIIGLLLILSSRHHGRRIAAVVLFSLFAVATWLIAFPPILDTGDSALLAQTYASWPIQGLRFGAHLSYVILHSLYQIADVEAGDLRPLFWLSHLAGAVFLIELAIACAAYDWTEEAVRYAGLAIAAPVSLMFFGYPELGYLSMTPLAFPLLMKGGRWVGAGAVVLGVHAALHGFGVIGLAGAALMGLAGGYLATVAAFGTAAYLGWIFLYVVGINAGITTGHAEGIIFRPLFAARIAERRELVPILSAQGIRDVVTGLVMAGAPLVFFVRSRPALLFAIPSVIFSILWWPIQGLAVDSDLVLAAFPAVFALLWMCAQSLRGTLIAFGFLLLAHLTFWWVVQNESFVNFQV